MLYQNLLTITLLLALFPTYPTVNKIYQISSNLKFSRVQLSKAVGPGQSITHSHIQSITKKADWQTSDLVHNLKRVCEFHQHSDESMLEFSQLVMNGIELERQWSPTHHIFYHGSLGTKLILLETVLAQAKQQKEFKGLFLLRSPDSTDHLKAFPSSHNYTIKQIQSIYTAKQKLGRFDNENPIRTDLLSVNTAMLANLREGNNEDSISYMAGSRFGPRGLGENIDKCLQNYQITNLPKPLRFFLNQPMGSLTMIFIPKPLAHLAYLSHPFGIPLGLPQGDLLCGELPMAEMQKLTSSHQEIPLEQKSNNRDLQTTFPQARILLKPEYFACHNSPVRMELFLWQNQQSMVQLHDNFQEIKALAKAKQN